MQIFFFLSSQIKECLLIAVTILHSKTGTSDYLFEEHIQCQQNVHAKVQCG